ncbi:MULTISPECIES: glycosyltransferase family 2 protein [unclassified Paenibacillus]|uniref:glycosyltransferase family 2 protein n=1 Tax=unclassified Paenibacillus TaxID=185978 RepID=UPI001AE7E2C4|nr:MULTISPECIES: glycosyltransferase family 2 protein [unclassified Paenibacillus]MBP1157454.1 GT2 family glycosyltransferase [Paenibacillus sp. PvP091]MBP1171808.1 GT2 family glycosyltransferase [Paenibacillus sp. PvR098]MBP2438189.1 GT2 family glycosyltransferase [Paenibacillus sp. PvP052]
MDLSIIIVNYNTCELTLNCLKSVYESQTSYRFEVLLIDNHSQDASVSEIKKHYPEVRLFCNNENVGFSRANNQGIRVAKGTYVLLLNSDTVVQTDTFQNMIDFMEQHPRVGAAGCKVVLPDGSLDKACRRGFPTPSASFYYAFGISKWFPNNPKFNQYQLSHLDPDKDYPVDCLVGAFMMVRKETIDQVGMLDEDFFMYGEDIDWCYRIKEAGWEIHYYPYTQIVHYKGASSRRKPFKIIYEFHRAMYLFHRKHYRRKYSLFINSMVYIGIGLKLLISIILNRFGSVR